jgi:carbon storage regulator
MENSRISARCEGERTLCVLRNTMLVLSRKVGERILIGDHVTVTVVRITGGGVRLGIEAPAEMAVIREELQTDLEKQDRPRQSHPAK